jgi:hypothetical protein
MVSTTVTSGWAACDRMRRPLLDVVAVQSYDERLGRRVAEHAERLHDAVGHRVAGGDAAEDVDEHAADVRVDRMISSPSAMTCAEAPPPMSRKFGRLHAAVRLAGVRHDVEGAHDEPAPLPMIPTWPSSLT